MKGLGLGAVMAVSFASLAFAGDGEAGSATSMYALAAGLAIGVAALGGALGQGRAIASALEGIARNPGAAPKIQTQMIIGLALIESLVIYAFVISFMILGKF